MARSPLIIDTPIGRLYCIDLGSGASMLMIEQDGQAITFPIAADEARKVAQYLRPLGKPSGSASYGEEDLKEAAAMYISDEAGEYSSRMQYVADQLGLTRGQANSRLTRARQTGVLTQRFSTTGKPLDD